MAELPGTDPLDNEPRDPVATPTKARPPRPAFPVIAQQRGLASSAQLRAGLWTADTARHARGRTIQQVMPGVFAPHLGPLDDDDRLVGAYLWVGEPAVLTGTVALEQYGIQVPRSTSCVFLVPASRRARSHDGVVAVRTTRPLEVAAFRECVPMVGTARALCDAATYQGPRGAALKAATLSGLQRRMTHVNLLEEEMAHRPMNDLGAVRAAMREFAQGAWSMPEASLARVVTGSPDLPEYLQNPTLRTTDAVFIGCPDGYFPSCGVATQVHSKQFHDGEDESGKDLWSATVEKDAAYIEHGIIVVPITPTSLDRRPRQVLARVRKVLAANAGRDVSHVVVEHPLWQAGRPGA